MEEINQTELASRLLNKAVELCNSYRHEFIMPEHLLYALLECRSFRAALECYADVENIEAAVGSHLDELERVPEEIGRAHV